MPRLRTLNPTASSRSEEDLMKAATARLLTGSLSAPVNRAVEQTLGVDLQITPIDWFLRDRSVDPVGARHSRQAAVEPRLRDLRASAGHDAERDADSRARIRPERSSRLGADAERRPHLLDRFPRAAPAVMRTLGPTVTVIALAVALAVVPARRAGTSGVLRRTAHPRRAAGGRRAADRGPDDRRRSSRRTSATRCRCRRCANPLPTSSGSDVFRTCRSRPHQRRAASRFAIT